MKIIESNGKFTVYRDTLCTYDTLPAGTYNINYSDTEGYYLTKIQDFVTSEKVYGVQVNKVDKVWESFELFKRSLGVILSGDKGIGKSLFAKRLCARSVEEGVPVLIVDSVYPNLARYLESIAQECVVLFDEFDKIFRYDEDYNTDNQSSLLSLFDGTTGNKKLFIVTCNNLYSLSAYLVNRPGRFHYHFRFDYPEADDVEDYLKDNLKSEYYGEIKDIVAFSKKVSLNYDCLRAIAFEINLGHTFAAAIADLNILTTEEDTFMVTLYCDDGSKYENTSFSCNLYKNLNFMERIRLWNSDGGTVYLDFDKRMVEYDIRKNSIIVPKEGIRILKVEENTILKPVYMTLQKYSMDKLNFIV